MTEPTDDATRNDDDPGHEADDATRRRIVALTVASATGTSLILSLLFFGERGDYLVAVLSLLLAFLFGMATFVKRDDLRRVVEQTSPRRRAAVALQLLALGGVVAATVFTLATTPVVDATRGGLRIEGADDLTPATPAVIVFRSPTPPRSTLTIQLQLLDRLGTGDCTSNSTLLLEPVLDGASGSPVPVADPGSAFVGSDEVQPGEAVEIPVEGSVQQLEVRVLLEAQEGCRLTVRVVEAVFHD